MKSLADGTSTTRRALETTKGPMMHSINGRNAYELRHESNGHQVALLIDFENVVFGLRNDSDDLGAHLDIEAIFRFSEQYGTVAVARAYGDWRTKELNQYQLELDRAGAEVIHVFSRGWAGRRKNATDVRMAVDATEAIWTMAHINTFVVVSGDRDFIHVLKTLRRYGKTIIGVATDAAASNDLAALCDRFVKYSALIRKDSQKAGEARADAQ